jgi:hypothetical protein
MASKSSDAFVIFVAQRTSCCEIEVLKITVVFRYMVVAMSNQNNLHEEFHSFVTNEDYIVSEGTGFDS